MATPVVDAESIADVIVVGAGVAGATASHAIAAVRPDLRVLVLERGVPGRGDENCVLNRSDSPIHGEEKLAAVLPHVSGTAVFDESEGPPAVKMMIGLYASSSADFLREHSTDDARTWFRMTSRGLRLQKEKAEVVLPSPETQLRKLGSIMVAPREDEEDLRVEYELLKEAGCNVRRMGQAEVREATGEASGFVAGLEFPDDAIIDSSSYAQSLLRDAESRGAVQVRTCCPSVVDIADGEPAVVRLSDGEELRARHVVVATGAFHRGGPLSGIIKPCYSYLVAMPAEAAPGDRGGMRFPNSPNLFTYGFSHDWCLSGGMCRMSGEDHFSALKLPRAAERCQRLAEWTYDRFPQLDRTRPYGSRYGVYSETPDLLPVFGTTSPGSGVCYIVGCNAWGQAVMSCLGHLVPAVFGFRLYEEQEREIEQLCSVRRFPIACEYEAISRHSSGKI